MDSTGATLVKALEQLGWPPDVAAGLAQAAHVVTYEKGATVFHAAEPVDLLFVLLSGEAKLYYSAKDGERLLVGIVRSGTLVGTLDLSPGADDATTTQVFTAQALSRCKIAILTRGRVTRALGLLAPEDILAIAHLTADAWARRCQRLLELLTMNVRGRLVYTIREMARVFGIADARGKLISLKLSHEDFADLVGASRPMVSKHLKELAKAGIFTKQHGRYVLWQEDMLDGAAAGRVASVPSSANLLQLHRTARPRTQRSVEMPRRRASR
jgi:CRP/FNR family cyclic AMP-dependent transcriptional regulator